MAGPGKDGMDPGRWERLKKLFDAALALDEGDRTAFVVSSCDGDPELEAHLASLLRHAVETGSTFDQAVVDLVDVEEAIPTRLDIVGHVFGRYRVGEKIGAGGMGEVYRAVDTQLGRDVAIKILPEEFTHDSERLARFEREARVLASLNHPNIATIHGLEEAEGVRFLVLELIEGETLRDALKAGPLPTRTIVRLAAQIADGLAKAHDAGIVHRDLKPENLKLTADGHIKILDFGLAKSDDRNHPGSTRLLTQPQLVTEPGRVMGTSSYMSPEQARGDVVDHRSDQFAFGSVLYEMATGQRAFAGATEADTLVAILRQDPVPPEDFDSSVPAPLRWVLERCLAKEPGDRYESTRDLARELQNLNERYWEVDTTKQAATTASGAGRRRRLQPMGWLLVVLALIAAAWIGWRSIDRTDSDQASAATRESRTRNRESDTLQPAQPSDTEAPSESASIAVLPFENLGPPDQEYFADGMTDALITQLSKIEALRVISRTSVMRYKKSGESLPEIARELGVETVLTGSVLHGGGRVRISAQLTEADSDQNLWADSYEEALEDILGLQSQVAEAVVEAIRVEIQPDEQLRLAASRSVDPAALEAYLRGIDAFEQAAYGELDSNVVLEASFQYFKRAIDLEPEWAEPYARLATGYHWLASRGGVDLQAEYYPKAKAAAQKALELDDTNALAHAALGWVLLNHEWNWSAAEAEYQRSLELDPNSALGHYGLYLRSAGRYDEAIEYLERDAARRPGSSTSGHWIALTELCAGRPDEPAALARKMIETAPENAAGYFMLGQAQITGSQYEEAVRSLGRAIELSGDPGHYLIRMYGYALARSGHLEEASRTLHDLEGEHVDWMPELYLALGDKTAAMTQIEVAFAAHRDVLLTIRCYPEYEQLMQIPRFREIVDAIGFPN